MAQILQTLDRGISILKFLALADEPKMVAEIATTLDLERTAVFRCLTTLASQDLVLQDSDSRWQVDQRAAMLAPPRIHVLGMRATPVLQDLANAVGTTACLTVAQGNVCMALKVCEPPGLSFHVSYREGSTHPIDMGASGLAILAAEQPSAGERPDLAKIRNRSYASSLGELQPNAHGYAVAIPSVSTQASVGLISLDALEEVAFLEQLTAAAQALGQIL